MFRGVGPRRKPNWRVASTSVVAVTRFASNAPHPFSSCSFKFKSFLANPIDPGRRSRSFSTSTQPPFNPEKSFKPVSPPAPEWKLGEGLPARMKSWREDVVSATRKTWDLDDMHEMRPVYQLLTSAIVPRPIALVSTVSTDGQPNLAPFSYFSMVSHNPPMISLSFSLSKRRPKDTRENILQTKEFTVTIVSEPFVEAANATSVESPASVDEWIVSGLTKEASNLVKPPFVHESAVAMECTLHSHHDISPKDGEDPSTTIVLAYIKKVHVRESVLTADGVSVDPAKLRPVARLGGTTYARQLEGFDLPRISWKAIKEEYEEVLRGRNRS